MARAGAADGRRREAIEREIWLNTPPGSAVSVRILRGRAARDAVADIFPPALGGAVAGVLSGIGDAQTLPVVAASVRVGRFRARAVRALRAGASDKGVGRGIAEEFLWVMRRYGVACDG